MEKKIEVELIDCQFMNDIEFELREILLNGTFNFIGISCYTPTYAESTGLAVICKRIAPKIEIVFGGAHPSLYPQETLEQNKEIDFIIQGEGEYPLYELLRETGSGQKEYTKISGLGYRKDGQIIINKRGDFIANIDVIPIPAYNIFPLHRYKIQATSFKRLPTYTMVASRGCPYHCTFCQVKQFLGSKMRYKSPEKVIHELIFLKENFQAKGIMFQDSTFTCDWKWLKEFCSLMIQESLNLTWMCFTRADRVNSEILTLMKKAGCHGISYGVESANQKSLDLMKKGIKIEKIIESIKLTIDMGLFVTATYMLGLPGEDEKDLKKTIALADSLATHIAHFYLPIPYPESDFYYQCKKDGGLRNNYSWEDFNLFNDENPVYINPRIGKQKLLRIRNEAIKRYYTKPKVIFRNLKTIDSSDDFKKYFFAAKALIGVHYPGKKG